MLNIYDIFKIEGGVFKISKILGVAIPNLYLGLPRDLVQWFRHLALTHLAKFQSLVGIYVCNEFFSCVYMCFSSCLI